MQQEKFAFECTKRAEDCRRIASMTSDGRVAEVLEELAAIYEALSQSPVREK